MPRTSKIQRFRAAGCLKNETSLSATARQFRVCGCIATSRLQILLNYPAVPPHPSPSTRPPEQRPSSRIVTYHCHAPAEHISACSSHCWHHPLTLVLSRTVFVSKAQVLNSTNVCSPNIRLTGQRTMIRFVTELLVRRKWFGQFKLDFVLNWLVMRCKLRPELAADAQQTA